MMYVFDIEDGISLSQTHSVVAESMAEAERVYKCKYWPCTIKRIILHSEYVQIQKYDEQAKEAEK
jgi:hypothetical protein